MDLYGLIGHPLGHSFSKDFFNQKFQTENIDAQYLNFDISTIELLNEVLTRQQIKGLNVTIPYKEKVIPFLDELSEEAKSIGAVNVIKVYQQENKIRLKGFNTDVIGFTESLQPLLNPTHKKALILGTGGASKAVQFGLQQLNIETLFVSRRNCDNTLNYSQLTSKVMKEHTIVINCTPVGMHPHTNECPEIPYEFIGEGHILYDLVYNPEKTLFLKKGKAVGATTKNGLEMLLLQAKAAWNIWTNKDE
ncbi:MAG: shikimate dehydrogenase [Paraprevotella sp.]|nr:shikimate dehydrogenase [Paraprevotella sp.]